MKFCFLYRSTGNAWHHVFVLALRSVLASLCLCWCGCLHRPAGRPGQSPHPPPVRRLESSKPAVGDLIALDNRTVWAFTYELNPSDTCRIHLIEKVRQRDGSFVTSELMTFPKVVNHSRSAIRQRVVLAMELSQERRQITVPWSSICLDTVTWLKEYECSIFPHGDFIVGASEIVLVGAWRPQIQSGWPAKNLDNLTAYLGLRADFGSAASATNTVSKDEFFQEIQGSPRTLSPLKEFDSHVSSGGEPAP